MNVISSFSIAAFKNWQPLLVLLFSIAVAYLVGEFLIPVLRRDHLGQRVREDGPQSHLKKTGTPTFGGAIFLAPFVLVFVYQWAQARLAPPMIALGFFTLAMAAIGFADDYVKVRIRKEGLSVLQKTLSTLLVIAAFLFALHRFDALDGFYLPFAGKRFIAVEGHWIILFVAFAVFYHYAASHAVNLCDGVDGLCGSVTSVALLFIGMLAIPQFASSNLIDLPLNFSLIGGLLAFLIFNHHPAKIFMGDLGSLALGAYVSGLLFLLKQPWLFLLFGVIYVIEIASVLIQVCYFKYTGGKRIFKMSPIHHHFELSNWSEMKIVTVFTMITLFASLIALIAARI
ncbi:MAG: phospho-N-acetylmuramoyl-pentapeptide-transferase [Eubacteriales bacterium]|nr:phospho-N-acetylmuramoyl-pentapeptide-transferase [Eubacteriales bacterium]